MSATVLKVVGYIATAVGVVASLVSSYVKDKNMERIIDEKVAERFK